MIHVSVISNQHLFVVNILCPGFKSIVTHLFISIGERKKKIENPKTRNKYFVSRETVYIERLIKHIFFVDINNHLKKNFKSSPREKKNTCLLIFPNFPDIRFFDFLTTADIYELIFQTRDKERDCG